MWHKRKSIFGALETSNVFLYEHITRMVLLRSMCVQKILKRPGQGCTYIVEPLIVVRVRTDGGKGGMREQSRAAKRIIK
jgi:hypothetical protein